jgi:hypothetical protein
LIDSNTRLEGGTRFTLTLGRIMVVCVALVAVVVAIDGWTVFDLLSAFVARDPSKVSALAFWWADLVESDLDKLASFTLLLPVLFVTWHWRTRKHLERKSSFEHSRRATLWWWLVPIANLWMPFFVASETLRSARPVHEQGGWPDRRVRYQIVAWAAAFSVGRGGMIALGRAIDAPDANLDLLAQLYAGASIIFVASALACVLFIEAVSKGLHTLPDRSHISETAESLRAAREGASDRATSPDRLADLAQHPDPAVRAALAVNESTPDAVVEALSMDRNPTVARLARDTFRRRSDAR